MRDTILMDMDGTLLPMDMSIFAQALYDKIERSEEILAIDPDRETAYKRYCDGFWMMLSNGQRGRVNKETFYETLSGYSKEKREKIEPAIEGFYRKHFEEMKPYTYPSEIPAQVVRILKEKGYTLVIATNPVFPQFVQQFRAKWAGVDPKDFAMITDYTDTYACKPDLIYYMDILKKLGKTGEECYMVGNNVEEDLCAELLGLEVFFLDDYPIGELPEGRKCRRGGMKDFLAWAKELPKVK